MNNKQYTPIEGEQPVKTPIEELKSEALEQYDAAAKRVGHWNSLIPAAIRAYNPFPDELTAKQEGEQGREECCERCNAQLKPGCWFCGHENEASTPKEQPVEQEAIEPNESMICTKCGNPHYLQIDDAGSDREVERLCSKCFSEKHEPIKYPVYLGHWDTRTSGDPVGDFMTKRWWLDKTETDYRVLCEVECIDHLEFESPPNQDYPFTFPLFPDSIMHLIIPELRNIYS